MSEQAFNLVRQSVVNHATTDDERLLEQLRITREKELVQMQFLFRIFGMPCFPRGELWQLQVKPKAARRCLLLYPWSL